MGKTRLLAPTGQLSDVDRSLIPECAYVWRLSVILSIEPGRSRH